MALSSLRLRRSVTTTISTLYRSFFTLPTVSSPTFPLITPISTSSPTLPSQSQTLSFLLQSRHFRSSPLLSSIRKSKFEPSEEIGPDTILFEGCDYNHWLITMEFPKDPAPSPEEMVATYEKTCAAGLGISVEEVKKRMYACSTTTYVGFQAVMTEEESEKFRGVPGVVFILPDSYIDPQNKEYGGDKYDNGHITPKPPPFQYNNRQGGRYRDQNRSGDRFRYDQSGGPRPNQQRDSPYQGSPQGDGRNNTGPRNYPPQQNYGPQGLGDRRDPMPMSNRDHAPGGGDTYQMGRRDPMPSYQGNPNQVQQNNNYPHEQRNYAPPGQRDFGGDNRNYAPRHDSNFQGPTGQYVQEGGRAYGQGTNSEYSGPGGERFPQMDQRNAHGDQRNYAPIGQSQMDHKNLQGDQRNYAPMGQTETYQMDQRNVQEDQRNYPPMGQTGTYQGR